MSKTSVIEELRKLFEQITIEPMVCFCLFSDGMDIQGLSLGLNKLSPEDKVDLAAYLIKHLGIDFSDIENTIQLSDENKYMVKLAKKIQEGNII